MIRTTEWCPEEDLKVTRVLPRFYGHFKEAHTWANECLPCKSKENSVTSSNVVPLNRLLSRTLPVLRSHVNSGLPRGLLYRWKHDLDQHGSSTFVGTGRHRDEALARLKKELARVKEERDFLREAATFFARESSCDTRRFNVVANSSLFA